MTVEYKIAKHTCNVIRRQVQSSFPDLHIFFAVHGENNRAESFIKEKHSLEDHPCTTLLSNFIETHDTSRAINKNRSRFVSLFYKNTPGFLGMFKRSDYLALCFLNHDRFSSADSLKNHAYHIVWHALVLYQKHVNNIESKHKRNTTLPEFSPMDLYRHNLQADIFSATIQTINGKETALNDLFTQRIHDTLSAETGFFAEKFPFPVCIDTLEFAFKHSLDDYKKGKNPIHSAITLTEEFGKTYDETAIKQWRSFSIPAQKMAWTGHMPETILGTALFTGEHTHTQSIADMIAERIQITPQKVTHLKDNNPFTAPEANERLHKKLYTQSFTALLGRAIHTKDHTILTKEATIQNQNLLNAKIMGWSASALYSASNVIKHAPPETTPADLHKHTETEFFKEAESLPWDTLSQLSTRIFQHLRAGIEPTYENIKQIVASDEEFLSIYAALNTDEQNLTFQADLPPEEPEQPSANITDFISPNAIKRS
ncbi:MAG: hypothetical protein ACRBDL_02520 [Alphaproteobacteria bacterium]